MNAIWDRIHAPNFLYARTPSARSRVIVTWVTAEMAQCVLRSMNVPIQLCIRALTLRAASTQSDLFRVDAREDLKALAVTVQI